MRAAAPDTPLDLELPVLDGRALARRAAVGAGLVAAAVAALLLARGPAETFAAALGRALDADPAWVVAGAASELLSFGGYIGLLWLVGGRATPRIGLRESVQVSLGGAAATRLLPTGGAAGVAVTLWALRRAGLSSGDATRTLLGFLFVLYAIFLAAVATAGGLLALGLVDAEGPLLLSAAPAAGATVAVAVAVGLAAIRPAGRIGRAVRDALSLVRTADPRLLGAVAWWAFDAAVLLAMFHALGTPPALGVVVFAYFAGQVANTLPLPGAASGGMVGVLLAFGVEADLALASVLAYRGIAIWLPAAVGVPALGGLRRTVAAWNASTTTKGARWAPFDCSRPRRRGQRQSSMPSPASSRSSLRL